MTDSRPFPHNLIVVSTGLLLSAATACAGDPVAAPKSPIEPMSTEAASKRSHFRISAGWAYRDIGQVDFQTGSRAASLWRPEPLGPGYHREPNVGPPGAIADRYYINGSVRRDAGTAIDGTTSAWSYTDDTQVQGGFLVFQAEGAQRTTASQSSSVAPDSWGFDGAGGAPVIGVDWRYDLSPSWSVGLQSHWSWLGFDGGNRTSTFAATQSAAESRSILTDGYDLQGIIPPLAPYEGSGTGAGPLIDNIPSSRSSTLTPGRSDHLRYTNDIRESLDVDVHAVSLGVAVDWRVGPVTASLSGGPVLTIAHWDASHQESIQVTRAHQSATQDQWRNQAGGTDVLPGLYLQGALTVPIGEKISLTGFGRYDWSDDLEAEVGPSQFSVELSGWTAGVLVGIRF